VVLGLAALAASFSRPVQRSEQRAPIDSTGLPELAPEPAPSETASIRFSEGGRQERRVLRAGSPAVVTVKVKRPGQVALEGLGLTAAAEPLTPARFDVLPSEPGRHYVRFAPAGGQPRVIGVLRVTAPARR
jgi:hypothetical protein